MLPRSFVGTLILLYLVATGCAPTARDVWAKSLRRCAENDLLKRDKDKLLYLGPSNVFGPGSGWRVNDDGSLEPRWALPADQAAIDNRPLIIKGREVRCEDKAIETFTISPSVLLQSLTVPINGDAKADITSSNTTTVTVNAWREDNLDEVVYEKWKNNKQSAEYGDDLNKQPLRRRVMKRAIAVRDFSATLVYNSTSTGTLKGTYKLNEAVDIGGGLTLKRTADSTLTLSGPGEFYIVGTLIPLKADGSFGIVSPQGMSQPVPEMTLPADQTVVPSTQPTLSQKS